MLHCCSVVSSRVFSTFWMVFRFDLSRNWSQDYTYGPGYVLIFLYGFLLLALSLFVLIRKSLAGPRFLSALPPFLTALGLVFYNAGYALNIPFVRESVLTVNYTLCVILFLESVLISFISCAKPLECF